MEDNLKIYNMIKKVPDEAQKKITGGRLSGMTDIKPMWRIEKLTEVFGPCGLGWSTTTRNREIIDYSKRNFTFNSCLPGIKSFFDHSSVTSILTLF